MQSQDHCDAVRALSDAFGWETRPPPGPESFREAIDIILVRATLGVPPILAFDLRTVTLVASFLCLGVIGTYVTRAPECVPTSNVVPVKTVREDM